MGKGIDTIIQLRLKAWVETDGQIGRGPGVRLKGSWREYKKPTTEPKYSDLSEGFKWTVSGQWVSSNVDYLALDLFHHAPQVQINLNDSTTMDTSNSKSEDPCRKLPSIRLYLSGFLVIRDFPLNFSLEVGEIWKNGDVVHVLLNGLVRDGVDQTRRAHGIRTGFSQSSKNSLNAQDYIPNSRLSEAGIANMGLRSQCHYSIQRQIKRRKATRWKATCPVASGNGDLPPGGGPVQVYGRTSVFNLLAFLSVWGVKFSNHNKLDRCGPLDNVIA
ncbi:hypothetical protein B0H14DRAFT_2560337 [Mycena olivaceomarginata]|nr:hypothetical protein B0H14DRAFT_2560337 [Mycena olivaceomarginata]